MFRFPPDGLGKLCLHLSRPAQESKSPGTRSLSPSKRSFAAPFICKAEVCVFIV